uniref:MATH domain-containing protein n=1 Tax=Meloidogyne hapla TaxID=6305 RepID=A0A1I8AYQ6_MELHA
MSEEASQLEENAEALNKKNEELILRGKVIEQVNKKLNAEKNELTRKLHAIKNFRPLQGCIKLTLEKFRILALNPTLLAIYSGPIQLGGFHWKLCAERSVDNWLGLYLCIYVPKSCPEEWECRVNFTFCMKHISDVDACIHRSNGKPIVFSNALGRRGRSGFADFVGIYIIEQVVKFSFKGFADLQDCVKMGVSFTIVYSTQT